MLWETKCLIILNDINGALDNRTIKLLSFVSMAYYILYKYEVFHTPCNNIIISVVCNSLNSLAATKCDFNILAYLLFTLILFYLLLDGLTTVFINVACIGLEKSKLFTSSEDS